MDLKKIKDSKWYQTWIWKKYVPKRWESVKAMMKEIDDDAFVQKIYLFFKYKAKRVWAIPGDIKRHLRMKIQRANRGWAVSDAWGFDYYLSDVIIGGCKWLRENKHGCPCIDGFNSETDEGFKAMDQEWNRILEEIIWTFETSKRIQDNWMYPHGAEYFSDENLVSVNKTCEYMKSEGYDDYHVMTKEEVARYRQGWKYFQEYYVSLWD